MGRAMSQASPGAVGGRAVVGRSAGNEPLGSGRSGEAMIRSAS